MHLTHDTDSPLDLQTLKTRSDVRVTTEQTPHESRDHCSTGTVGRAVAGVTNDAGEVLLLVNDEHGVALLPNETVEPGDSWLGVARDTVTGQTGIGATIDDVLAVRTVEHVADGDEEPHLTTHRVVFAATATGDSEPEDPASTPTTHTTTHDRDPTQTARRIDTTHYRRASPELRRRAGCRRDYRRRPRRDRRTHRVAD